MLNSLPSEKVAVSGVIDPDANTAATLTTEYVNMGTFQRAMGIILAGTLGSSATLDAKLVQATDAAGTGKKDITGKAMVQLTQAGSDSDKQVVLNVRASELDAQNDFAFVAIEMTTAVATSDSAAILLGMDPRIGVASDSDLASVDEIVE